MGVYEVERIVAKRVQGGRAAYFIQWQSYSQSENTWEPAEHLPEELITAFENRTVDPFRADECRERLAYLGLNLVVVGMAFVKINFTALVFL